MLIEQPKDKDRTKNNLEGWKPKDDKGYLISLNSSKYLARMLRGPHQKQSMEEDLRLIKSRYLRPLKIISVILIVLTILFIITTLFMLRFE